MSFTSAAFLLFLAVSAILYYALPARFRWTALLGASFAFYILGGGFTVLWLCAAAFSTWLAGLALGKLNREAAERKARDRTAGGDPGKDDGKTIVRKKKRVVFLVLLFNFGILWFLKYGTFLGPLLSALSGGRLRADALLLPLGISFYIFQSAGYVIDCYRNKIEPEKNPLRYALFVSFFPQMVQGPIGRYDALAPQLLRGNPFSAENLRLGIGLMLWGWLKKLVIADRAGVVVEKVFSEYHNFGGAVIAVGVLFYCVQLYCDFSGGIEIARGAAKLFGVDLAENFRRPIFARSLAEYWRRWHITLGQWMRDYVFYPLALSQPFGKLGRACRKRFGNRVGKILPTSLATFIVYLLIGIWHGGSFRFIAYGFWNGAIITFSLLMEEKYRAWAQKCRIDRDSVPWRVWQTVRTCGIVFLGRYITRAPRFLAALWMLSRLIVDPRFGELADGTLLSLGLPGADLAVAGIGVIVLLAAECAMERGVVIREWLAERHWAVQWAAILAPLLILLLFGIMRGDYIAAEFIYQQY